MFHLHIISNHFDALTEIPGPDLSPYDDTDRISQIRCPIQAYHHVRWLESEKIFYSIYLFFFYK